MEKVENFIYSFAGFLIIGCIALLIAIFPTEKIKCENLADMYGTETKMGINGFKPTCG